MARKPVNQHRMLTAVDQGRVSKVKSARWCGSWQIWDPALGSLRPVTSAENMALDVLAKGERPMIAVSHATQSDYRSEIVLTEYGVITLQLWNDEMGPVTNSPKEA